MKMWTMGDKLDEYDDIEAIAVTIVKNNVSMWSGKKV